VVRKARIKTAPEPWRAGRPRRRATVDDLRQGRPLCFPYGERAESVSKLYAEAATFAGAKSEEAQMGDVVYLALGVGCFVLFYLFARALSRL
jgi:hypothetical protein